MDRRQSLASRITSGDGGIPPKATWWSRHGLAAARYLVISGGQTPQGLAAARAAVNEQTSEWDKWAPTSAGKTDMERHMALEIELVDAARRNDEKGVERAGDLLVENAAEQARRLGSTVASFPEERFRRLLEEHVRLFAAHVRLAIEKKDARPCTKLAEANSLALADLTVEWF